MISLHNRTLKLCHYIIVRHRRAGIKLTHYDVLAGLPNGTIFTTIEEEWYFGNVLRKCLNMVGPITREQTLIGLFAITKVLSEIPPRN